MGYHVIDPETVEPGERIPLAYHYHDDGEAQRTSKTRAATPRAKEEVFSVESGDRRVETPDGERVVPEGHVFVVESDA